VKVVVHLLRGERERHVQLALHAIGGTGSEDADDRVRTAVDPDGAAEEAAIAGKPIHPELVGEDDDFVAPDGAFLIEEVPPRLEPVAHHRQETRCRGVRRHLLRPFGAREVDAAAAERAQPLEHAGLPLPFQVRGGRRDVAVPLDSRPDHHEPVGIGIRQRRQQGRVHDAEYGGVGGNPEGKGQHRHGGEPRVFFEEPDSEAGIAPE
jgi:hypothetical protein